MMKLYPGCNDLALVMEKYDVDGDGKLSFQEFADAIMPRDQNYASLLLNRKSYNMN